MLAEHAQTCRAAVPRTVIIVRCRVQMPTDAAAVRQCRGSEARTAYVIQLRITGCTTAPVSVFRAGINESFGPSTNGQQVRVADDATWVYRVEGCRRAV